MNLDFSQTLKKKTYGVQAPPQTRAWTCDLYLEADTTNDAKKKNLLKIILGYWERAYKLKKYFDKDKEVSLTSSDLDFSTKLDQ